MKRALTSLTGQYWEKTVLLTKYGVTEVQDMHKNIMRLTNQLWKLIPMREHEEDWKKQLESVVVEIAGMNEIIIISPTLMQLLAKLEGLQVVETTFEVYRKTVFESINLLQEFGRAFAQ